MTVQVTVDIDTLDVEQLLRATDEAVSPESFARWMETDLFQWFSKQTVNRFAFEGDFRSGDWPALADATVEIRQSEGYTPDDINIRSGELFDWAVNGHRVKIEFDGAELMYPDDPSGEVAEKARVAQMGEAAGANEMFPYGAGTPARPVIAWDDQDAIVILGMATDHVAREIMRAT